jgi:cytoskeletal protein CcmA (bactofilin family)
LRLEAPVLYYLRDWGHALTLETDVVTAGCGRALPANPPGRLFVNGQADFSSSSSDSSSRDLVIGQGVSIKGSVHAPAGVNVMGTIEGDLHGGQVVVGESGVIRGSLRSKTADIHGEVSKDAEVSESIILRKSSRLKGELRYRTIEIEAGAQLTCSLKVIDDSSPVSGKDRTDPRAGRPDTRQTSPSPRGPGPSGRTQDSEGERENES